MTTPPAHAFAARTGEWIGPDGQFAVVDQITPTAQGTIRLDGWTDTCPVGTCHGDHRGTPWSVEITPEAFATPDPTGWRGPIA